MVHDLGDRRDIERLRKAMARAKELLLNARAGIGDGPVRAQIDAAWQALDVALKGKAPQA